MLRKGSLTGLLLFGIFYRVINFGQLLLGLSFQAWELPL